MSNWSVQSTFNVIGTSAVPVTLSASYAVDANYGNPFSIAGMQMLSIKGTYTPKAGQTNGYLQVKVSVGSSSANMKQWANIDYGTSESNVYTVPFIVPGDKTTTGGTAYPINIMLAIADSLCKIEVLEAGVTDWGTVFLEVTTSGK